MADQSLSARDAIVTVRSLPEPSRIEAAPASTVKAEVDPVERAMLLSRYRRLRDRLEEEAAEAGDDVMVTAPDPRSRGCRAVCRSSRSKDSRWVPAARRSSSARASKAVTGSGG